MTSTAFADPADDEPTEPILEPIRSTEGELIGGEFCGEKVQVDPDALEYTHANGERYGYARTDAAGVRKYQMLHYSQQ